MQLAYVSKGTNTAQRASRECQKIIIYNCFFIRRLYAPCRLTLWSMRLEHILFGLWEHCIFLSVSSRVEYTNRKLCISSTDLFQNIVVSFHNCYISCFAAKRSSRTFYVFPMVAQSRSLRLVWNGEWWSTFACRSRFDVFHRVFFFTIINEISPNVSYRPEK